MFFKLHPLVADPSQEVTGVGSTPYHIQHRLDDKVNVDDGGLGPVLHGPHAGIVVTQERSGELIQGGPPGLLR